MNRLENLIIPNWPAQKNIRAYTTTRKFLNDHRFKFSSEDDREFTTINTNRQLLISKLDLPTEPLWLTQVHGTEVVDAANATPGVTADAAYTNQANIICTVLTADCVPILLCDQGGIEIAAIHAGWRGLSAGIIEQTVKKFTADPRTIMAWLGPAIGPSIYEVGDEVREQFIQVDPEANDAFTPIKPGKWLANLFQLASQRLASCQVTSVYGGNHCTYSEPELFFSYRRDHGQTGSLASMIWKLDQGVNL